MDSLPAILSPNYRMHPGHIDRNSLYKIVEVKEAVAWAVLVSIYLSAHQCCITAAVMCLLKRPLDFIPKRGAPRGIRGVQYVGT